MESDVETGSALFTEEVLAVGDARVAEARHIPTGSGVSRRREREPGESGREENERVITYGSLSQEREERVQDPVPRVPSMHSRLPTRVGAIVCDLCDLRAHSHATQGRQWSRSRGGVGLGYDGQRLQKTMDSMGLLAFHVEKSLSVGSPALPR